MGVQVAALADADFRAKRLEREVNLAPVCNTQYVEKAEPLGLRDARGCAWAQVSWWEHWRYGTWEAQPRKEVFEVVVYKISQKELEARAHIQLRSPQQFLVRGEKEDVCHSCDCAAFGVGGSVPPRWKERIFSAYGNIDFPWVVEYQETGTEGSCNEDNDWICRVWYLVLAAGIISMLAAEETVIPFKCPPVSFWLREAEQSCACGGMDGPKKEMETCRHHSLLCAFSQAYCLTNYVAGCWGLELAVLELRLLQSASACLQHLHHLSGMDGAGKWTPRGIQHEPDGLMMRLHERLSVEGGGFLLAGHVIACTCSWGTDWQLFSWYPRQYKTLCLPSPGV